MNGNDLCYGRLQVILQIYVSLEFTLEIKMIWKYKYKLECTSWIDGFNILIDENFKKKSSKFHVS